MRLRGRNNFFLVLIACSALTSCVSKHRMTSPLDSRDVSIQNETPESYSTQEEEPELDERPYEGLVLEDAEGSLTKFYYLRPGRFDAIQSLIPRFTGIAPEHIESNPAWGEKTGKDYAYELMLVRGSDEEFIKLDDFLDYLEAQVPMIEIEAQIVEVLNDGDFQFGIQTALMEIAKDGGDNPETLFRSLQGIFDTNEFTQSGLLSTDFQGLLLELGTLHDEIDFGFVIQALATRNLANVLSTPKIRVLNGFKADITIGEQVPIQTFKSVSGTALIDVTFKEAAVKLTVIPEIVGKDSVRMEIIPEVTRITGFTDPGSRGLVNPILSTRNASTTVNIRNGFTYVIGGLIGNTEIEEERKTPFLGDIPLIKYLFRSTRKRTTDTNLLFIIKPTIIYPEYYGKPSKRLIIPDLPGIED